MLRDYEFITGYFGPVYLTAGHLAGRSLSNCVSMVDEYLQIEDQAWHLISGVKLMLTPKCAPQKTFLALNCYQSPTLSQAAPESSKLKWLIGWRQKCILLMEWGIIVWVFSFVCWSKTKTHVKTVMQKNKLAHTRATECMPQLTLRCLRDYWPISKIPTQDSSCQIIQEAT